MGLTGRKSPTTSTTTDTAEAKEEEEIEEDLTDEQVRERVDKIIDQCLGFTLTDKPDIETGVTEREFLWLLREGAKVIMRQPMLLRLEAPIRIVGDIHGQYLDLLRIFHLGGFPPEQSFLFLGDYVDRGPNGLECMCLLVALKVRHPNHVFLLRGNHECESINRVYGFFAECKRRYTQVIWEAHITFFMTLPLAAIVSDKIFCIHGGLSPALESLEQIESLERPLAIPTRGMVVDFLWSDPDADVRGWAESERGISFAFGSDVVRAFLRKHNFELLVRAHQVVEAGYELFADRRLVTLFSAPNYCGEFDNVGAIMVVNENLECSFKTLSPNLKNGFAYSYEGRPTTPHLD